jgi:DNA-binding IclR family transcriptional regulator
VTDSARRQCGEDLLAALASDDALAAGGLTVSQLAAATDRDRGLVSRAAADLVALGLADREPESRKLRLGWRLYAHAARIGRERLWRRAGPVLRELAETTGESAYAAVRSGTDAVIIAEATPAQVVVVASWAGRSTHVARSDAGPMLLADLSPAEIRALLGDELPPATAAHAPKSLDDLLTVVEEARTRGVSVLDEQAEPDAASAAAAVRDHGGATVAAIVIRGPWARTRDRLDHLAARVRAAAAELSRELGAVGGG